MILAWLACRRYDWLDQIRRSGALRTVTERATMIAMTMSVEARMRLKRKELGLSQRAAAKLLGVSQATIAQIEHGVPSTTGVSESRTIELLAAMDAAIESSLALAPPVGAGGAHTKAGIK